MLTGEVALDVALRLMAGQKLLRVVPSPQALVIRDNMTRYTENPAAVRAALIAGAGAN